MKWFVRLALTGLVVGPLGCASRTTSSTPRTAIEQLLLSRAVDLSLEKFDLPEVADKKVYLDFTNLKSYDVEYVKVATRGRFARLGSILVNKPEEADYIAEVASGCLGTEDKKAVIGIPGLPVPQAATSTPEVPFFRTTEQTAIMKLLIFVHQKGKLVALGHYYAKADRDEKFLLWYRFQDRDHIREGWESSDAELKRKKEK